MEKITIKTDINAKAEKVWQILFGVESYPKWAAAFMEGSQAATDWKKGSKALFTDGKGNGMVAIIEENIQNKFLSIKHLGELKDGKEELQDWGNALENYTLEEHNDHTTLIIDMNVNDEWKDYLVKTWPKALEKVKELAEAG
ncbi:SRPBCC domain-containing protein [Pedobacter frigidisoli]|uniref:SRPBCC domain-containing protein n=1 Tax=Pedobacter frigidisoli TaxID=2530455 RepID=A0A4R0P316_9SPHI|nr:SRPBCC domain-containing protein [Pedobacter frigidisoli]TCD11233.1 SRPBCC domain-containing protein [Pedobacter frigidisoli]